MTNWLVYAETNKYIEEEEEEEDEAEEVEEDLNKLNRHQYNLYVPTDSMLLTTITICYLGKLIFINLPQT